MNLKETNSNHSYSKMEFYYQYIEDIKKYEELKMFYNYVKCHSNSSKELYSVLSDMDRVAVSLGQNLIGRDIYHSIVDK